MDEYFPHGHKLSLLNLPLSLRKSIEEKDYSIVFDEFEIAMENGQWLSNHLKLLIPKPFLTTPYTHELMLSLREGPQDEEQEGIWHDDSSRDLIFSLSLTQEPEMVKGGELELRRFGSKEIQSIPTQPFGTLIFFPSGKMGWEHRISRVTAGNRLVLVGWLSF